MSEKTGGHISAKFWNFENNLFRREFLSAVLICKAGQNPEDDPDVKTASSNEPKWKMEKVVQKPAVNVKLNAKCDKGVQFQSATPTVWFRDLSLFPLQKMCFFAENADKDLWTMFSGIKCEKERARVHSLEKQDIYEHVLTFWQSEFLICFSHKNWSSRIFLLLSWRVCSMSFRWRNLILEGHTYT